MLDRFDQFWPYVHMQAPFGQNRLLAVGKRSGGVLLIVLLLLLGACASSPTLHKLFCPDAGQPWDYCVITKFVAGSVEAPLAQAAVAVLFFCLVVTSCWNDGVRLIAPPFRLSPSRAPPFWSSLR